MSTNLYIDYIRSSEWENRKTQFKSQHPKRCFICHSSHQVELHHLSYIRLGNENDEDLCWLCLPHHIEVHSLIKKSSATYTSAHWIIKKRFDKKPRTHQKRRKKFRRHRQIDLKPITELFNICVEIFSFHGLKPDWSNYESLDNITACKSISYMYNVLTRGDGSWVWQGDLLCSSVASTCLDPSEINKSEYWCLLEKLEQKQKRNKRKEMSRLASARRNRAKNRRIKAKNDLYNQHVREARIENKRLG